MPGAVTGLATAERLPEHSANTLKRTLGLEVELTRIGTLRSNVIAFGEAPTRKPVFSLTHDGSVNGDAKEAVLAAAAGDAFIAQTAAFAELLNTCECKVDRSAGMHVHVGAKDLSYWDLRRLIRLYFDIEADLFTIVAPWRSLPNPKTGKNYCAPMRKNERWRRIEKSLAAANTTHELKRALIAGLYGINIDPIWPYAKSTWRKMNKTERRQAGDSAIRVALGEMRKINTKKSHKYEEIRYFALNLHSWMQRGTIEFRHAESSVNPEWLLYWPLLCGWIVEAASRLTDRQVESLRGLEELVDGEWVSGCGRFVVPEWLRGWVHKRLEAGRKHAAETHNDNNDNE